MESSLSQPIARFVKRAQSVDAESESTEATPMEWTRDVDRLRTTSAVAAILLRNAARHRAEEEGSGPQREQKPPPA